MRVLIFLLSILTITIHAMEQQAQPPAASSYRLSYAISATTKWVHDLTLLNLDLISTFQEDAVVELDARFQDIQNTSLPTFNIIRSNLHTDPFMRTIAHKDLSKCSKSELVIQSKLTQLTWLIDRIKEKIFAIKVKSKLLNDFDLVLELAAEKSDTDSSSDSDSSSVFAIDYSSADDGSNV